MKNEKRTQELTEELLNDSQQALREVWDSLNELEIALNELIGEYDTSYELNYNDLKKYANGDKDNEIGEKSFRFLYEHRKIMWFVRTARMYCDSAKEICDFAQL